MSIAVQFKKPIVASDFVEAGMKATLTKDVWLPSLKSYHLTFDFSEYESENISCMTPRYLMPASRGKKVTAKAAGHYGDVYSVVLAADEESDEALASALAEYVDFLVSVAE